METTCLKEADYTGGTRNVANKTQFRSDLRFGAQNRPLILAIGLDNQVFDLPMQFLQLFIFNLRAEKNTDFG